LDQAALRRVPDEIAGVVCDRGGGDWRRGLRWILSRRKYLL